METADSIITLGLRENEAETVIEMENGYLLHMQESDNGYDYTVYDSSYEELDGGQIDNPDISLAEACADIMDSEGYVAARVLNEEEIDDFLRKSEDVAEQILSQTDSMTERELKEAGLSNEQEVAFLKTNIGYLYVRPIEEDDTVSFQFESYGQNLDRISEGYVNEHDSLIDSCAHILDHVLKTGFKQVLPNSDLYGFMKKVREHEKNKISDREKEITSILLSLGWDQSWRRVVMDVTNNCVERVLYISEDIPNSFRYVYYNGFDDSFYVDGFVKARSLLEACARIIAVDGKESPEKIYSEKEMFAYLSKLHYGDKNALRELLLSNG